MQASQASATARTIALATVLEGISPANSASGLISPCAVKLCSQMLAVDWRSRWLTASVRWRWSRALWRVLERCTLPGIGLHYARRKQVIEQIARQAIADGTQRIVLLGAGFDTLALRLAREFPVLQFVEVDHPATQAQKRRALLNPAFADWLLPNLRWLTADFAQADQIASPWLTSLGEASVKTLFIAEGLLMYLPLKRIKLLLGTELAHFGDAQVLLSYMARWPDGRVGFRPDSLLIQMWLAWVREPFLSALEPEQIAGWMGDLGLQVRDHVFAPLGAAATPALLGENLLLVQYRSS
jgi:O-methyltransferase involved in polyketide biosynthesis